MGQATILRIGTAVPTVSASQEVLARWMQQSFADDRALSRWIGLIYAGSGIEKRHACVPIHLTPPAESPFSPGRAPEQSPGTAERMHVYREESVRLGVAAARRAVGDPAAVTHLIAVSCTGFFAPGLDIALARELNLPKTVRRTVVGFMGCSAAFNGLRLATEIVAGNPSARVLVVCVEICSMHIQPTRDRENLVAQSLFADGAAAALVGIPAAGDPELFAIDGFLTRITPDTHGDMVWTIGNHGFALHLSPSIPRQLAAVAPDHLASLFGSVRPGFWAIHPGGRAIVDGLAEVFDLKAEDVAPSRGVLREYGNLSSPTILFVLQRMAGELAKRLRADEKPTGVAMAFGPGLVTEMAALTFRGAGRSYDCEVARS